MRFPILARTNWLILAILVLLTNIAPADQNGSKHNGSKQQGAKHNGAKQQGTKQQAVKQHGPQQQGAKFPKMTPQGHGAAAAQHGHGSPAAGGNHGHGHGYGQHQTYRPDYNRGHSYNHFSHGHQPQGYSQLSISPYGLGFSYTGRNLSFSTGGSRYYQPSYGYGYNARPYYGFNAPGYGNYGYPNYSNYGNPAMGYDSSYLDPYSQFDGGTQGIPASGVADANLVPKLSFPIILTNAATISAQQRAEAAFRDANYEEAAKLARQSVRLDPENGMVRLFSSQTQFAIGDYDQAAADLLAATKLSPSEQWSHIVKNFRSFYGKNDYVAQTDRLSRRLQQFPNDVTARAIRGFQYGALGYPDAATEDFLVALSVKPNDELTQQLLPVLGSVNTPNQRTDNLEQPVPAGFVPNPAALPSPHGFEEISANTTVLRLVPETNKPDAANSQSDSVLDLNGPTK